MKKRTLRSAVAATAFVMTLAACFGDNIVPVFNEVHIEVDRARPEAPAKVVVDLSLFSGKLVDSEAVIERVVLLDPTERDAGRDVAVADLMLDFDVDFDPYFDGKAERRTQLYNFGTANGSLVDLCDGAYYLQVRLTTDAATPAAVRSTTASPIRIDCRN